METRPARAQRAGRRRTLGHWGGLYVNCARGPQASALAPNPGLDLFAGRLRGCRS